MISIDEVSLEEAFKIHQLIPEFDGNPPYTLGEFKDRIKGNSLILMAKIDSEVGGYMASYDEFNDGSFYIWLTGVLPKFRTKGIFSALRNYQEEWAKEKGYKSIKVKTWNKRVEMRISLAKAGYNIIGFEKKETIEENRLMHQKKL